MPPRVRVRARVRAVDIPPAEVLPATGAAAPLQGLPTIPTGAGVITDATAAPIQTEAAPLIQTEAAPLIQTQPELVPGMTPALLAAIIAAVRVAIAPGNPPINPAMVDATVHGTAPGDDAVMVDALIDALPPASPNPGLLAANAASSNFTRAAGSHSSYKLPGPGQLTTSRLKTMVHKTNLLANWATQTRDFLIQHGFRVPQDIPQFVSDDEAQDWVIKYISTHIPFEFDTFLLNFQRFISGEVRSQTEIARSLVVGRSITQGDEPAVKYAQRFMQSASLLPDECQSSLCQHYIAGLNPVLRQRCVIDRNGRHWTVLHALLDFSYSEEMRISSTHDSSSSRAQEFHQQGRGRGRAAAIEIKSKEGDRKRGPPSGGEPPSKAHKQIKAPMTDCKYYKHVGTLSKSEKSVLSEYGLCWYCRAGVHLAQTCPQKAKHDQSDKDGAGPSNRDGHKY
jgi:hypothetical protein